MVKVVPPEHIFPDKKNNDTSVKIQINESEIHNGWKLVLVMILSLDEKILENLQARIIGDFFCYRHHNDTKIRFQNLNDAKNEPQNLSLENLITDKSLLKFVTFDGLKKQSYLRFKENHFNNQVYENGEKKPSITSHLLCVTIKNSSYVFNLDKQIENNGKA